MLSHELSCPKVRLLLSGLMLKDAGRNCYAVPGVDQVVSYESRQFADNRKKPSSRPAALPFAGRSHPRSTVPQRTSLYTAYCLPRLRDSRAGWPLPPQQDATPPSTLVLRQDPSVFEACAAAPVGNSLYAHTSGLVPDGRFLTSGSGDLSWLR